MIISTSSRNVQLTPELCEYIENTLLFGLSGAAEEVVSLDAMVEALGGNSAVKAVIRVDLRNLDSLSTEVRDDSLYTAIRRGTEDIARAIDRQLQPASQVTAQRLPEKSYAFAGHSAPTV